MGLSVTPVRAPYATVAGTLPAAISLHTIHVPSAPPRPMKFEGYRRTITSYGHNRGHDWQKESQAHLLKIKRRKREGWGTYSQAWHIPHEAPRSPTGNSSSSEWGQSFWPGGYGTEEHDLIDKEFARFKEMVDADPYGAVFGRRLRPFSFGGNNPPSSFWQSLFCPDNSSEFPGGKSPKVKAKRETESSTVHAEEAAGKISQNKSGHGVEYKFDPISCRMVPNEPVSVDKAKEVHTKAVDTPVEEPSSPGVIESADQDEKAISNTISRPDQVLNPSTETIRLQSPFTRFESYINQENKEAHQDLPSKSQAIGTGSGKSELYRNQRLEPLPVSHDSESARLDSLKPGDVRASYERRAPKFDASKETMSSQDSEKGDQTESGSALVGENRNIYGDNCGPISSEAPDGNINIPRSKGMPLPNYNTTKKSNTSHLENQIQGLVDKAEALNADASVLMKELREALVHNTPFTTSSGIACESTAAHENSDSAAQPMQYRILAYDPLKGQVKGASMTSASPISSPALQPADTLSQLKNATQFLSYLPRLEAEGYELHSAGPEMLVFQKRIEEESEIFKSKEPSAATTGLNKGNSQSNSTAHQETASTDRPPKRSSKGGDGAWAWGFAKRAARGVGLAGIATGGSCYAIGVVAEYFRTGGQDGLGPSGFTGLEGR